MALSVALTLLAAATSAGGQTVPAHVPTSAVASAQASVRILSAAKISLSDAAQPQGYTMKPARVTVEDGTQRDAKLVEFQ
jgi:hypothetical protein